MNKAIPKIKETAEEIREMLKNEPQVKRQNRLQALYLIATKQAKSRSQVAQMLGFNRNTISDWFSLYEAEGLEKRLEFAFNFGGQCLTAHHRKAENRRKYRLYIFAGVFTGIESDWAILERVEGLAVGLKSQNNDRGERINSWRTKKFFGKSDEFDNIFWVSNDNLAFCYCIISNWKVY